MASVRMRMMMRRRISLRMWVEAERREGKRRERRSEHADQLFKGRKREREKECEEEKKKPKKKTEKRIIYIYEPLRAFWKGGR